MWNVALCRNYCKLSTKNTYRSTVLLPSTGFTVKHDPRKDFEIQESSDFKNLYNWQYEIKKSSDTFILHDGPPYANGDVHVGHALNKILKDVTCRFNVLCGKKVHYVPGWDCHGLPIEAKALKQISNLKSSNLKPAKIRTVALEFALKNVEIQKASFKKWGLMADWNNIYKTIDTFYNQAELEVFQRLYNLGYIFHDFMPVYWSPSSETALAEAELEYNPNHKSLSVFVTFPLLTLTLESEGIYALVWTTTPWTLPANEALCISPKDNYVIVRDPCSKLLWLVAEKCVGKLAVNGILSNTQILKTYLGEELLGEKYVSPLFPDISRPILGGDHVHMEDGTGIVHTAPAHGREDFAVGKQNGLNISCVVDGKGRYTASVGIDVLKGRCVLSSETAKELLNLLGSSCVATRNIFHKYPYNWRDQKPIIWRASDQWFIDVKKLGPVAEDCINKIHASPNLELLKSSILKRPYWCISRQRSWGLPLPALVDRHGETVTNAAFVSFAADAFKQHGTNIWFDGKDAENILLDPVKLDEKCGISPNDGPYTLGRDILDIWFDSGVSWKAVLPHDRQADLYWEGLDQLQGWFQSSLLLSAACRETSPFKRMMTHGFVVDGDGKKMSKSKGNVVDPNQVLIRYGVDTLRWWAAAHFQAHPSTVPISDQLLKSANHSLRQLRLIFRYLLGNLSTFKISDTVAFADLKPIDQYMMGKIGSLSDSLKDLYECYHYSRVCETLLQFSNIELSSFYIHMSKDSLYCESENSPSRLSCQTVLHSALKVCTMAVASIAPHLAFEVSMSAPSILGDVFKLQWMDSPAASTKSKELEEAVELLRKYKSVLNADVVQGNNPRLFDVYLDFDQDEESELQQAISLLGLKTVEDIFQVSNVEIGHADNLDGAYEIVIGNERMFVVVSEKATCERCRRKKAVEENDSLCTRCRTVLDTC